VVESGSFGELIAKRGRFAALAKAQFMVDVTAEAAGLAAP
jgi:hypothetical protein